MADFVHSKTVLWYIYSVAFQSKFGGISPSSGSCEPLWVRQLKKKKNEWTRIFRLTIIIYKSNFEFIAYH